MEPIEESQFAAASRPRVGEPLTAGSVPSVGLALAAGAALRLWMLRVLFEVNGDSLIYGGIAKNLLLHGRYALTAGIGITYPTLIRLPGYPLFLALCFRIFGMENYFAVGCVQIFLELAGCLLLAAFARKMAQSIRPGDPVFGRRAGLGTLWLAALCPFTASYAPRSMAETLSLFVLALAMLAMAKFHEQPAWNSALAFTFAVTGATLLRPDGALAAVAFAPVMVAGLAARHEESPQLFPRIRITLICVLLALAPFAVWSWRNWRVFHVFQPLAPRLATDPGERTNPGWERWIKSWCLDFVSTYEVYWNVPDDTLDVTALPDRAFDSPAQYQETAELARDYNTRGKKLTPDIDARFARLADKRIADHPLRYYLWLPIGRVADMWLRPRTENLPMDLDWWVWARHHGQTLFAWCYVALNGAYLLLALVGIGLRPKFVTPSETARPLGPRLWLPLLAYMILRSLLLLTVEAPEARYTLQCFPMLFALGGVSMAAMGQHSKSVRLQRTKVNQAQPTARVSRVTGMPTRE